MRLASVALLVTAVVASCAGRRAPEPRADHAKDAHDVRAVSARPIEAIVRGRLVGPGGEPIANARVRLTAYGGEWTSDMSLAAFDGRERGVEVASATDGSFVLVAPPTRHDVQLVVEPVGPYACRKLTFTAVHSPQRGPRLLEPLDAGEHDVGTQWLARAGSLRGRVIDDAGVPLDDVELEVTDRGRSSDVRHALLSTDGCFVLPNLTPGVYRLVARSPGRRTVYVDNLAVDAGTEVDAGTIVSRLGPRVRGRLVERDGRPVGGLRVRAVVHDPTSPSSRDTFVNVITTEDGRFELGLCADRPVSIVGVSECRPFDAALREKDHLPGATDLEIPVERSQTTTLVVRDAATGAPIEAFETWASRERMTVRLAWSEPQARRPFGLARVEAQPDRDFVVVRALGHVPVELPVRHDDERGHQLVFLERGATVRGRVLAPDGSAVQPIVSIRAAASSDTRPSNDALYDGGPIVDDLCAIETCELRVRGDPDGSFRLDGLAAGTYDVRVGSSRGAPLWVRKLRVAAREDVELGVLRQPRGTRVDGRIRVPAETDAAGFEIERAFSRDPGTVSSDANGAFTFEHVGSGTQVFRVRTRDGTPVIDHLMLEIAEGAPRAELAVDLALPAPCRVRARVSGSGAPLAGAQLELTVPPESQDLLRRGSGLGVGRARDRVAQPTDTDGVTTLETSFPGTSRVRLRSAAGQYVSITPETLAVRAGESIELAIEARVGAIELVWPVDVLATDGVRGTIVFTRRGNEPFDSARITFFGVAGRAFDRARDESWTGRRWRIGELTPGLYDVVATLDGDGDPRTYGGVCDVVRDACCVCELARRR